LAISHDLGRFGFDNFPAASFQKGFGGRAAAWSLMPAFKFRLNFLIALRRQREEEAAVKLARRLASIADLEESIQAMFDHLSQMAEEVKAHGQTGRLTGPLLRLYGDFQLKVRQDLKKAEELLILSRREEAKERVALTRAVMARQVIEKAKERQRLAFEAEAQAEEQKNLEEMASMARVRRLKETGVSESDDRS
jgi:flagellar export protein FliJ